MRQTSGLKSVVWVGSSLRDLRDFPVDESKKMLVTRFSRYSAVYVMTKVGQDLCPALAVPACFGNPGRP